MAGSIEIFNDAINGGLILTKFNLCCPDCDGPYSLSNYQDFETKIKSVLATLCISYLSRNHSSYAIARVYMF